LSHGSAGQALRQPRPGRPVAGEVEERSIAGQIEFWARLGRAVEIVLRTDDLLRLKRRGEARPMSELLTSVDSDEGRRWLGAHLASRPQSGSTTEVCDERVAMRVLQCGHDVPTEKVLARFPRTLANLARAIRELPHVLVFDNTDLVHP
jgi:hypothetical protein